MGYVGVYGIDCWKCNIVVAYAVSSRFLKHLMFWWCTWEFMFKHKMMSTLIHQLALLWYRKNPGDTSLSSQWVGNRTGYHHSWVQQTWLIPYGFCWETQIFIDFQDEIAICAILVKSSLLVKPPFAVGKVLIVGETPKLCYETIAIIGTAAQLPPLSASARHWRRTRSERRHPARSAAGRESRCSCRWWSPQRKIPDDGYDERY